MESSGRPGSSQNRIGVVLVLLGCLGFRRLTGGESIILDAEWDRAARDAWMADRAGSYGGGRAPGPEQCFSAGAETYGCCCPAG